MIPTSTQTPTHTFTPTATPSPANTLLPTECGSRPVGSTCDAGLDFGNTLFCIDGECVACVPDGAAAPQFVDHGDGTVTDRATCLVWEKKDDGGGIHDKDNRYSFSLGVAASPLPIRDGTVYTEFLTGLNTARFAGHGDWRMPTTAGWSSHLTGQNPEVEGLRDVTVPGCAETAACIAAPFDVNCGEGSSGNPGCSVDGSDGEECSCAPFDFTAFWTDSEIPTSGPVVVEELRRRRSPQPSSRRPWK